MVIKIELPQIEARHKATAVYKPLYEMLHDWFMEYGYSGKGGEDKYMETLYSVEENPGGDTIHIWWRLSKNINKQIRYVFNFDYLGVAVNDIEVQFENKKIKAQKGELTMYINARIELDYENKWDKSPLMRFFQLYLRTRALKANLEMHKRLLQEEAYKLDALIKRYFDMYQFTPEKKTFVPKFGYE
ncbi:MAG: hypothetical protein NTV63_02125 [Candidatus Woesearchaeota archaeon]|nr:hypothetical protein [Candidatus Woesearchaeota archaeon]